MDSLSNYLYTFRTTCALRTVVQYICTTVTVVLLVCYKHVFSCTIAGESEAVSGKEDENENESEPTSTRRASDSSSNNSSSSGDYNGDEARPILGSSGN